MRLGSLNEDYVRSLRLHAAPGTHDDEDRSARSVLLFLEISFFLQMIFLTL